MSKIVLITGAAGNLGKAAVTQFVNDGYHVVATVSPGKPSDNPVPQVEYRELDLTNESASAKCVNEIITEHHQINAAAMLVGGFAMGNIEKTDGASLRKMFALNFDTAYFIARPVFLQMKKQVTGGRIVLVGSRPSLEANGGGKDMLAYALSKSLLFKLAEYLNAEGAANHIVTSVIVPSTIDTPENRASMPKADFSKWVKPEEIASNIAYLCSSEGSIVREPVLKLYGDA